MNWHQLVDSTVVVAAVSLSTALAQSVADQVPVNVGSIIVVYGPMAGMLIWFMWRWERLGNRIVESHDDLKRAIWASIVSSRHDPEDMIREQARRELGQ